MRYITTAAAALVLCVLLGAAISAQTPSLEVLFQKAEVDIARADARVQQWSRDAQVSWMVVVVIALLGIITAAVQALDFKAKGFTTAVIGGLVSGATVYSAATLPADYKTLNSLVSEGNELVASARVWLEKRATLAADDRLFALNEIATSLRKFDDLDITKRKAPDPPAEKPSSRTGGAVPLISLIPVVHAAEPASMPQQCDCSVLLQRGSKNAGELIACATAAGTTLRDAHTRAVTEASKTLASQLRRRIQSQTTVTTDQMVDFVQRFATEEASCPGSGKTIQLSVLLRLPERLGYEGAITAFAKRDSQARLRIPTIRVVDDGSPGDTGWTFDILVDGRLVTRLPARDYSDRDATRIVNLSGANAVEASVGLPKGSFWLVEVKGQRTKTSETAIGGAAIGVVDKPVEIAVANPVAKNGSFVFTVSFAKP
jgi:hypothetical protein